MPSTVQGGGDLKFEFRDTYIAHTFTPPEDGSTTADVIEFLKDIYIEGDWPVLNSKLDLTTNYGYVYVCENLDGNADCDNVQKEDLQITINDRTNYLSITSVFTTPNNLRSATPVFYSDLFL